MSDRVDFDMFRALLMSRRSDLQALSGTLLDAAQTVELDQTRTGRLSRMDALQRQAMAHATEQRRRMELRRIETALVRLDTGEYGECLECGEMIAAARLRLDPAATLCLACAEQAEESAVRRQ
jgi:DnaK suppressor protein